MKSYSQFKIGLCFVICLAVLNKGTFADTLNMPVQNNPSDTLINASQSPRTTNQDAATQAMVTANQYQHISDTARSESNQAKISKLGTWRNRIFNMSIFSTLKSIIINMELQTKKLEELIKRDPSATTSPDSSKLQSIVDKLDEQRKALIELISVESKPESDSGFNTPPDNPTDTSPKQSKFTVFDSDK